MIRHEDSKWVLYNKKGDKKLGEFTSQEKAKEREKQINYFKYKNKIKKIFNL